MHGRLLCRFLKEPRGREALYAKEAVPLQLCSFIHGVACRNFQLSTGLALLSWTAPGSLEHSGAFKEEPIP